jgi:hypothetical protein
MSGLFSNPAVDSALKALTPEQRAEYEAIGKYMFQTDFATTGKKVRKPEEEMKEGIDYISGLIKSGLDPNDLSDKELLIMQTLGDDWVVRFGYEPSEVRKVK